MISKSILILAVFCGLAYGLPKPIESANGEEFAPKASLETSESIRHEIHSSPEFDGVHYHDDSHSSHQHGRDSHSVNIRADSLESKLHGLGDFGVPHSGVVLRQAINHPGNIGILRPQAVGGRTQGKSIHTSIHLEPEYHESFEHDSRSSETFSHNSGHRASSSRGGQHDDGQYAPRYQEYNAKYDFGYGVRDDYHGTNFGHQESRDGDLTQGEYYVHLPNGKIQRVTYYADKTGYHPTITYIDAETGRESSSVYDR